MRAKTINEDIIGDQGAETIAKWAQMYHGDPNFKATVRIPEPVEITFEKEDDYHKLLFLLKKYRIPFEEPATVN